jgi:hybrid polyketide synthase/nonribosomal peptide synthetase ACE1
MVLRDTMLADMDIDAMNSVLKPKVDGSHNLDELFSENTLDFFVFFSSATCVTGNLGQSNYAVANMFMTGLAANRRKRGLAGSVIDIGAIIGVGYVTRETSQELQDNLVKSGHNWMSEEDFHTIFAEAIIAGNPGNDLSPELVTGLRIINASDAQRPLWADMPRFQHMVTHEDVRVGGDEAFRTVVATRTQLLAAKSQDQVQEILRGLIRLSLFLCIYVILTLIDAFVNKLHVMLQFDEEGKRATIIDQSTADLGIDSLNAVEIRSWFLKELKVDMPILRILSGATVGELLAFAQEKLPEEFLQGIGSNTDLVNQAVNTSLPQAQSSSSDYVEIPEADSSSDSFSIISSPGQIDDSGQAADLVSSITTSSSDPLSPLKTDVAFQRTEAMSFGQSRFWFLKFYLQEQTTFNITCSIALKGDLRIDDFERAVNTIGQRHEALRTCFFANEEQRPMQGVLSKATLKLERKNFENDQDLDDEMARLKEHIYDIERGQIMRILLLSQKTSNSQYANRHQILIGYHHINMDGISLQIILSELERAYSHQTLNSSVLQYPDFTSRQRRDQSNGTWNEDIAFWKKEFPDFPPDFAPLGLSDVKFRRPLIKYDHHRVDFRVKSTLAPKIKAICRTHKVTPYHFYLAAFEVLLHRFSGATDFCVGVADGNRTETDMSESVGFFLNLLPLRLRIGSDQSFAETLKDARAKAYSAMAHSRLPFDILLNELNVPRAATHNPLFQVFLDYRQGIEEKRSFGNCQLEGQQYETGKTSYDIALDITDNAKGEALLMIAVQKELYSFQAAETLMQSFVNLVEAFTKNPSLQLDEPALFRREEVEKAIVLGRGAIRPAKWPATLSHRVDDMIGSFGDNLALKDGSGSTLTYNKMSQRVNSIALGLMNAGLSTGAKIGVFQNPSSDWICSMLAILRIGAVYVPLDLRLTIPRLAAIVADCLPDGILADSDTIEKVPDLGLPVLSWTINVSLLPSSLGAMIANCATPNSAATILYTSGSTGAPKGTVLKHEGLRNNIEGNTEEFQVGPEDSVLQQISLSFDFSMWQIFMALANGASLYVVPKSLRGDTEAIVKLIADEKITFTGATPSEYTSWLHYGDSSLLRSSAWNMAVSAGEEVTLRLKQDLLSLGKRNLRFFNGYGPTEASLSCSKTEILYFDDKAGDSSADARVSAGFTAPNYAIYIVDEALNPVPVGVPGQILIGGAGVASGYLNNNEMTKERFTTDKHAPLEFLKQGWNRVHLTGDQGRLRDDGALVIEGRISGDTQIKLRGLRIDLQDIETTIIKCSNGMLHEAVVSLRRATNSSPDFLVAHVQFASTYTGERDKYLQELVKRLPVPQYMRPAMMISLDRMPISNHFKLDRKAINNLEFPQSSQRDLASLAIDLTETESHLIDVWESVISKELVSFHEINKGSDFFHVGGNSLLLVNLKSEINKIFGVDLPLVELFQASTLEDMASRVQSGATSENVAMLDWNDETTLPSELFSIPLATSKRPPSAYKTIILTGATGFLGRAILQRLVDDKRVTKIHCVAVRDSPKTVIFNSSKVVIHKGDLGLPRLGLPKSLAASLFQTADAIIHNGADVSFLKTYTTLKPVNVQSTIELVKLSLPYQIPFHYISTTGVGNLLAAMTFEEASVNQARPAADGSDGYVSTKWVSERLLEKIAARFHQRVLIHRPSSITGEDAPQLDVMHNLLTYSRKIRAVPVSTSWSGYLDFISVERTAREVCEHTLNVSDKIDRLGEVEYLHHAGELRIELENMKGYMEKETGESFRAISMGEWANEAEGVGLSGLVGAYLKKVEAEGIKAVFPRIRNERGGGGIRS